MLPKGKNNMTYHQAKNIVPEYEGKTIKSIKFDCVNVFHIDFTDGTSFEIMPEIMSVPPGMSLPVLVMEQGKYQSFKSKVKTLVRYCGTYKDGGTKEYVNRDNGQHYFLDVKGKIWDRYPKDCGAIILNDIELVEKVI
jgi:hypothetical protein